MLNSLLVDPSSQHYGYALAEATGFAPGTIYPILARLEAAGWLVSTWEQADPAALERPLRRTYRVTEVGLSAGRAALTGAQRLLGLAPHSHGST